VLRPSICACSICILFFCVLNWGCTKIDNTTIGSGLLPAVDNVNTFDTTFKVIAINFDSVFKDCAQIYPLDDHVLGTISNDPYFGTTMAAIFTELKPATFPYKLPTTFANITLDSVVLVLSYKRLYGDSLLPQKVDVYEVSKDTFRFDSSTSTCTTIAYDPLLLGSATYIPKNLKDTFKGFEENSPKELRIKLNNSFGETLLSRDSATGFGSDSLFKAFFKGFAIVPDINFGGNALTYYSLADTNTKLAVYFKYSADSKVDTTVINFRLTSSSATTNNIVRNHAGAEITSHLSHPPAGDDVIYIQASPGTYAELKIPGLTGLSNRIIHRAELVMEQVHSFDATDGYFTPPSILYLEQKVSDTTYRPIPCDFNTLSGQPNFGRFGFGGGRTTAKDFGGNPISTYTFNMTRYVQKIVTNGITNTTLKLSAPDYIVNRNNYIDECGQPVLSFNYPINNVTVGRIKLGGGNNQNYPMRLRIVYSNL
jgi:hypothetical protein